VGCLLSPQTNLSKTVMASSSRLQLAKMWYADACAKPAPVVQAITLIRGPTRGAYARASSVALAPFQIDQPGASGPIAEKRRIGFGDPFIQEPHCLVGSLSCVLVRLANEVIEHFLLCKAALSFV